MVSVMLKSALREIRHNLGRYLAILAIIGLGVGFFAGLRMCQPSMIATGIDFIDRQQLYDYRLISPLGFTGEDVAAFQELDGVAQARGGIFTDFLAANEDGTETVYTGYSLTEGINEVSLVAGRLPERANECVGDAKYFTEADLGREICVSENNDEDTLSLLACDSYTLVGTVRTAVYLGRQRGTSSIGSGTVAAFLYFPRSSFDSEVDYQIYLTVAAPEEAYSRAYDDQISRLKTDIKRLTDQRTDLRFLSVHDEAMAEIRDAEQELADGWEEYYTECAEAERELADALQELTDGEQAYQDALADYAQGRKDYAQGLLDYEDGVRKLADARQELDDGWAEYEKAKADTRRELADALRELEAGEAAYQDGERQLRGGSLELSDGETAYADGAAALDEAGQELAAGEASYSQLTALYGTGSQIASGVGMEVDALIPALQSGANPMLNAGVDAMLQSGGSSLEAFLGGWQAAETELEAPLTAQTLSGVRSELSQGRAAYESSLAQLSGVRSQLDAGWTEVQASQEELVAARRELDDGWAEYNQGKAEAEEKLADAYQELQEGEREYTDARHELEEAEKELTDARTELDSAPGELVDARVELDDGWTEYDDGAADADREFADAEQELHDGEQEIEDAYQKLGELEEAEAYVLTREENSGYVSFENDITIVKAISVVFPVFFFLVAALVCMTTMTRMVDEQRTQIGVLKALGYSNGRIIGKYLLYSGSAALVGGVTGYLIGSYALPAIIWQIYAVLYDFAPLKLVFSPLLAGISLTVALACAMGSTYLACRVELAQPAAELIRPRAPKAGRRVFLEYITPLWKRLSFLRKVSVRNVLRYRSRLVMMLLGIGGCTALLVTGFGLRDSIKSIVDDQFDEISVYDYSVTFSADQTEESVSAYLAEHSWLREDALLLHNGNVDVETAGGSKSVFLVTPEKNSVEGFVSLHSGKEPIAFPAPGQAVVNTGLAQQMGIKEGDTLRVRDGEIGTLEVTVSAICDNYVYDYIYISADTFLQQLGRIPGFETLYLRAAEGADPYADGARLSSGEKVSRVTVNESTREYVDSTLERMDYIVVIVVLCAGALAVIVQYNLTNINIAERIREIATIKVLGFYRGEVGAYVMREIIALSVMGSLMGLAMGKLLHRFVMAQVRIDSMFFPCWIAPTSYLWSLLLTIAFTVLISLAMRPRLNRVDMAESLKSIE